MAIFSASPSAVPACVLITGATGGIGGALAAEYSRVGTRTLILQGRNRARLDELARDLSSMTTRVLVHELDIRDDVALRRWLTDIAHTEAPDLVIVNAGVNINTGPDQQGESWGDMHRLFDVNIKAAMATLHTSAAAMQSRGHGQIALISSLAAWRGLPDTPSYSASKAAVKVYGEAMRDLLAPQGVKVNVVMPGYVESKMCTDMPGPKPFLWSAEKAARVIRRGLARNQARISFPFPLNLGCFLLSIIHPSVSGWILRRLGYRG